MEQIEQIELVELRELRENSEKQHTQALGAAGARHQEALQTIARKLKAMDGKMESSKQRYTVLDARFNADVPVDKRKQTKTASSHCEYYTNWNDTIVS